METMARDLQRQKIMILCACFAVMAIVGIILLWQPVMMPYAISTAWTWHGEPVVEETPDPIIAGTRFRVLSTSRDVWRVLNEAPAALVFFKCDWSHYSVMSQGIVGEVALQCADDPLEFACVDLTQQSSAPGWHIFREWERSRRLGCFPAAGGGVVVWIRQGKCVAVVPTAIGQTPEELVRRTRAACRQENQRESPPPSS